MASIRRTNSPISIERLNAHQNGLTPSPLSISSPSHKLPQSQTLRLFSRNQQHKSWRKPFYRFLVFFFVGFLLGILPFGHNDVRTQDISFEIKPEHINVREEETEIIIKNGNEATLVKPDDDVSEVKGVVLAEKFDYNPRKLLIVVTPTLSRAFQGYYLNRLGQVLRLVNPPILWVVVEMNVQSPETAGILRDTGVMYRHLVCKQNSTDVREMGAHLRNSALEHIELHRLDGVVYFADDDNVYSLQLFEKIRDISHFGTWPVAILTPNKNKAILEGPVCNGSEVIGWHTNEKSKAFKRFHVAMSGFAFNSTMLWDSKRWKRPFLNPIRQLDTVKEGFQETTFIEQLVAEESQMEGIPDGCGKILNWHLNLGAHVVAYPRGWMLQKNLELFSPLT